MSNQPSLKPGPMHSATRTIAQWLISADAKLTRSERKVARALLANYPAAGLNTVATLAESAGVSAPTVVRFSKALGFASFKAFQTALRAELEVRQASALSMATAKGHHVGQEQTGSPKGKSRSDAHPDTGNSETGIARTHLIGSVTESLMELPETELQLAVSLIADPSRRVFAYGGEYSTVAAQQLVLQLAPLRRHVQLASSNSALLATQIADTNSGDVWCIFDVRRYHQRARSLASAAQANGGKVVLFTDGWLSPASSEADVVLTASVSGPGSMDTIVPMVALVELVCACAEHELGYPAVERLAQVEPARRRVSTTDDGAFEAITGLKLDSDS